MNHFWRNELDRLLLVILATIIIGLLTQLWFVAILLPLCTYIGWNIYQQFRLNQWIKSGMQTDLAPEGGGLWSTLVTHLHRREVSDRKREQDLRDLVEQYNTIISVIPDAAVVLNYVGEIEWANDRAAELLGIKRDLDRGRKITSLLRAPDLITYLNDPDAITEFKHQSPVDDKQTLAFRTIHFGDGQRMLTARDVSEEASMTEMRKNFMANASHELRTPLTVISGYLEILEAAPELDAPLLPPVVSAMTQASRMAHIIDDLLTLSRLEKSTADEGSSVVIDMQAMLENMVKDISRTIADNTHSIEMEIDPLLDLFGVELEVTGIASNLLKNAVKYTPAGSTIIVRWSLNEQQQACLSVIDNGDGIAQEHLPHLTERFYRVDPGRSRDKGGTGLGLAIIKHIIERHGGHLEISSIEGEGSTFTAVFPQNRAILEKFVPLEDASGTAN